MEQEDNNLIFMRFEILKVLNIKHMVFGMWCHVDW